MVDLEFRLPTSLKNFYEWISQCEATPPSETP